MTMNLRTLACIVLGLVFSEAIHQKNYEISHWAYIQKAGHKFDTGCLHNLTLNESVTDETFTPDDERSFLVELFNKTNGHDWKNKSNWGDTNSHHCQWAGVHCYPGNTYIKWIDLKNNHLSGTPPNFWKLRNLQGICLSRNPQLTGALTDLVSKNMTRLRRLCVAFTNIHGNIPWNTILQLKNLEKLQICCMTSGRLYGTLPADIDKLDKLQVLSLGENHINGDLPRSINKLTKLWFLDLEYVKLKSGNLSYLSGMKDLQYLHMMNCDLEGQLPNDFGKMHPNLTEISLLGNQLEGELTSESLVGLNKLEHLSLHGNHFSGLLPDAFSTLSNLKVLDLSHNKFTGFQQNMKFNDNLEILYLSNNKHMKTDLSNLIDALQKCKNFRALIATNCSLKGDLPTTMWDFELLTYLDLSNNELSGKMTPSDTYNMAYLFHLNLASNNLSGKVSTTAFFAPLKALTYFNITDNPLLTISLTTYLEAKYEFVYHDQNYSCPTIEITSTKGIMDIDPVTYQYSLCFCNHDFYGYTNQCLPCMDGGTCQKEAISLIVGDPRTTVPKDNHTDEVKMTIKKGYWPWGPSFDDVQRLVKCSEKVTFGKEVCNPSEQCQCRVRVTDNGRLTTSCNQSCICHYGNTGRFCSKCIPGYYKKGGVCVECESFSKNFPILMTVCFVICLIVSILVLICLHSHRRISLIVIGILVVAITILYEFSIIPGWFFIIMFFVWILGLSTESSNIEGFICIAIFYFQSLDAMLSETNIWPTSILLLKYKLTNIFNIEFARLTCSFHDGFSKPETSFITLLLLPVSGILLLWLIHFLSKVFGNCIPSSLCKRLTIQLLLLVYFPITARTLSALSPCTSHEGISYLKDSPWLDCHGTSYTWLTYLGSISLALFVITIPLFVFLPLLYNYVDADGNVVSPEKEIWLKPLYNEFKQPYRRWFPLFFLARRLFLAIMLSLVDSTSCYQILGIALLLLAFLIIVLVKKPYEGYSSVFAFENTADIVISVVLLLSFVAFSVMQNSSHIDHSLVDVIVIINIVVVLFCVGGLVILFAINLLRKPDYEVIQN